MLGPLPTLHRFVIVLSALLVCVGLGFWLGAMPASRPARRSRAIAGTAAGIAAAFVLVHDFHQRHTRQVRARRRVL